MIMKTITTAMSFLCAASIAGAATLTIENEKLAVSYDNTTQTFSVAVRATGKAFLTDGKLEGTAKVKGRKIIVTQPDGDTALELRGNQPFLFVTKERLNAGTTAADVSNVVLATFRLELGTPAAELRTMGTGGLLPVDKNPGSYLFLTCADPVTRRGVVAGWVTQDRGSGVLFSEIKDGKVSFTARIDYGHLQIPAGKSAQLETLAIGFFEDARVGQELYADWIQKHYDIKLRPRTAVYCSWYADEHGGPGDEKSSIELGKFITKELKPYGLTVVQVDGNWESGKEYNGPSRGFLVPAQNGGYPNGFKATADALDADGLLLGLWTLPFARNFQDPAYKDRQDWFVKRTDGRPYDTRWGGTCLDLTHPEVRAHLAELARTHRKWGVRYFKMDGLWTGAVCEQIYINDGYKDDHFGNNKPLHDPSMTNIEAFRSGLKLLRQNAGDDVIFSGCNLAQNMRSIAAIGLVDFMRVGPDFNHDGQGIKTGPIRASRLYFLNGRVWWNDPDPAKVRTSTRNGSPDPGCAGAVSLEQARMTASFAAISGQIFLISDWLPALPSERLEVLKRTMLSHTGTVRPVDYFDNFLPYIWHLESGTRHVIGLFNWESKPQTLGATLAKTGLDPAKTYYAFDFWKNTLLPDIKDSYAYELPPVSCQVIAVHAAEDHPVLLSTSRHVTQGIVDVKDEKWNGNTLSGTSAVIANDSYELRIRVPAGWKLDKARHPAAESAGLVRVQIEAPTSQNVKWRVSFTRQ